MILLGWILLTMEPDVSFYCIYWVLEVGLRPKTHFKSLTGDCQNGLYFLRWIQVIKRCCKEKFKERTFFPQKIENFENWRPEPNPKYDKIEHGVSCRKRQHGHGLDCGETRKKRYEKLNAQAIANGFAGVCRESATYEGKCRCGGKIWSDDEEICIPPLGEQKPMHMDCASEYMDVIKRESEAEMYYQDDGWD